MFRKYSLVIFFLQLFLAYGNLSRGTLLKEKFPVAFLTYIQDDSIDITVLRDLTNFLTNPDVREYNGIALPKRKKAFIRHIKHLSEKLEFIYFKKQPVGPQAGEILYELLLFKHALCQSTPSSRRRFRDKVSMLRDTWKSKRLLRFKIEQSTVSAPKDSPYWHSLSETIPLSKRFLFLAKLKKVKPRKNMVVIFDKLSHSGSAPKVRTLDLDLDNKWVLKWGDEVHTDVVGSRIFAALGYDVDHPYYFNKNKLTVVFDGTREVKTASQLCDSLNTIYGIEMLPFVSDSGVISDKMIRENEKLGPFSGYHYVRFVKCALEARPDRVKRIGPFGINIMDNPTRKALRGALLAHAFIDNWDTHEGNTLLTTVHNGNYDYRMSAVFSDLGTSLGVKINMLSADFKVGLVNELDWEVAFLKKNEVRLNHSMNTLSQPYVQATYSDLKWMALKIGQLDELTLRKVIKKSGWPAPIAELYFHKLASRRASILKAFGITDQNPIEFDRYLNIVEDGKTIVKDGVLITDYDRENNPESFLTKEGRFANYGN